ncbi:hypothetical protein DPMN_032762 [Dreissena polymorpha]|uniref:Uncharacterized protein n=1 Tax=Dreissena polymorpha TaxID=45954 RepID=A0A9D4RJ79_DREPO|nr:hypothetical protein DPMN_032762 [Dreissena polymorpha]
MATVPWLLFACLILASTCNASKRTQDHIQDLLADNAKLKAALSSMQKSFSELSRQVMMQQTFVEERIRSDGSSGVKQVRHESNGDRIYFTPDQTSFSAAGIHDHSDYTRLIGMGELNAVINGVEFRTRHNDYRLAMPASHPAFNAQVDIPHPEVPPSVLSKPTVAEQVKEMKLWFKAFKDQDHSVRDYRKYFQPVLCYLEGFWSVDTETVQEPFPSERHFIDAKTYADLHEKVGQICRIRKIRLVERLVDIPRFMTSRVAYIFR